MIAQIHRHASRRMHILKKREFTFSEIYASLEIILRANADKDNLPAVEYLYLQNGTRRFLLFCHTSSYILRMLYLIVKHVHQQRILLMSHQQSYQKTKKRFMKELSAQLTKQHIKMRHKNRKIYA
ncbi:hypothetical protein T4E_7101 [Trichinella pseudospiralis]|uniref:Uncharacterized protein n=1 Tax=Trichinella pseudospiralis TaxID=6337 RepID=A0A0V0YCU0_TRIPS|nr:hypothetical protein T4E_7101 [Trichinella pseudospiralis]